MKRKVSKVICVTLKKKNILLKIAGLIGKLRLLQTDLLHSLAWGSSGPSFPNTSGLQISKKVN